SLPLFRALVATGVEPKRICILGKAYSTNQAVVQALQHLGCHVVAGTSPRFAGDFAAQMTHDVTEVWDDAKALAGGAARIVVLDDGGRCIANCPEWATARLAVGVEQTSHGRDRLVRGHIPVVGVARSAVKLQLESPAIGRSIANYVGRRLGRRRSGRIGVA